MRGKGEFRDEPADKNAVVPLEHAPVDFLRRIKGMLVSPEYFYAEETLTGIMVTVQHSGKVTEGQARAIQHIEDAPGRTEEVSETSGRPRGPRRWRW